MLWSEIWMVCWGVSVLWSEILRVCWGNENEELCNAIIYACTLSSAFAVGRCGARYRERMVIKYILYHNSSTEQMSPKNNLIIKWVLIIKLVHIILDNEHSFTGVLTTNNIDANASIYWYCSDKLKRIVFQREYFIVFYITNNILMFFSMCVHTEKMYIRCPRDWLLPA